MEKVVLQNVWIKDFEGISKLLHPVGQPLYPFHFPVTKYHTTNHLEDLLQNIWLPGDRGGGWVVYWISERTTLGVASTRSVRNCGRSRVIYTLFEVWNSLMGGKVPSLCVFLKSKFLSPLDHEIAALRERMPYGLLGRYQCLRKIYIFQSFLFWWWQQQVFPKRWCLSNTLHDITSKKTFIFVLIPVTTSYLAKEISSTTLIWYYCHWKTSRTVSHGLTTSLVFRHKQSTPLLLNLFLNTP
jgi:hypothetical protein